jgi:L-ascorbate metabolism protein UlaG (beta-lactamase superfamily)
LGRVLCWSRWPTTSHGTPEPYFPEQAARFAQALKTAKAIIVSHEHGDHIAGPMRSASFAELAPKTVLLGDGFE